ncbi:class I SAM-dependent methyltransferase [uncultured Microscilla sp.]|uniref:class I SAM-dependent methyltransferase n=1 Tax=uncultured Microscilla sp. TaxID=432653 RepID=UPI0026194CA9|nr:class I SAM-dependent methyltransferase [uncultured Microscilla sp.]
MKTDTQRIYDFYQHYTQVHGTSTGWSSLDYALRLYDLSSSCPHQPWTELTSILDIGSGEGHFKDFLRTKHQFKGHYTGIEVVPEFHTTALAKYGDDAQTTFIDGEFLTHDFDTNKFDWVFSLGSLSVLQPNQAKYDEFFCKKMRALARYGTTIYLNDATLTCALSLQNVKHLATHNIDDFVHMLRQNFSPAVIEIHRLLPVAPQGVIIHVRFL